jgi:two-component system KDP operon response regulator KdpE
MTAVLVIEDEPAMRRLLVTTLQAQGFTVTQASSLAQAERSLSLEPAAILLDLGLPDGDGLAFLRTLRRASSVPVVVLSARDREDDKVTALEAGADDYLTKPFGPRELIARIRVALRHAGPVPDDPVLVIGPFTIDRARHEVTVANRPVHLTPIEFRMLALLVRHAGKVVTHARLLEDVWGARGHDQHHYLRVHMAALRRKVEVDPARPRYLLTEQGIGYRLRDD